jgi:DNA-binding IclR family transcriptional regulator
VSDPGTVVQPQAGQGGVQVIARVGQLFRALETEPLGLTLTELANRLDLPRSTVHRLVGALASEGLLTGSDGNGQVRIGPELIRIASAARLDLRQQVEPVMRRIFDAVGETVDCSVLDGDQLRVVEVIPTQHQLRVVAEVGAVFPIHCSSKGKAVLSLLSDDEIETLVPRTLYRFTPHTVTTRTQLMRQVAEVRAGGVAFDDEEYTVGVSAAAIAARDPYGSLFAISVPVPTQRFQEARDAVTETLLAARAELMELMGPQ